MTIEDVIAGVIAREGGYANDPHDAGGETMFGITAETARANGYRDAMRDMPKAVAAAIYRKQYVMRPGFDRVGDRSGVIAGKLVDIGVNMGPAIATLFLQRTLNALNRGGKDYADIAVDGAIGPATLRALEAFIAKRGAEGEMRMLTALKGLQVERYIELAEKRGANEDFLYGWLGRAAA